MGRDTTGSGLCSTGTPYIVCFSFTMAIRNTVRSSKFSLVLSGHVICDVVVQHFELRCGRDVNEYFSFHFAALIID